ncbi:MAG: protein kinase domain-containing protein [Armatimonadota bacterium]
MQFQFEKAGRIIDLQPPPLTSGGEADLFAVPGAEDVLAKIYYTPTAEHAEKLAIMIANPPDDPMAPRGHPSIAWPADRLFTVGSAPFCAGFVMPRVYHTRSVFEFYNPKTRRKHCPLFNYLYLVRTARNLAAAFRALHDRGYVVGDVNESNILVSETALVTMVDTDSFQVARDNRVYRCPVGKQEFTPPELQGLRYREIDRTPEHDVFGLAVLIFLLLMEGTHPFAGRSTEGDDSLSLADRIGAGFFPYGVGRRIPFEPMPYAPPIGLLHPEVRALMRRCFEAGHSKPNLRPTAAEWQRALDQAEHTMTHCRINPQHMYRVGIGSCPWCERAQRLGGHDPFPSKEVVVKGLHQQPNGVPSTQPTPPEKPAEV